MTSYYDKDGMTGRTYFSIFLTIVFKTILQTNWVSFRLSRQSFDNQQLCQNQQWLLQSVLTIEFPPTNLYEESIFSIVDTSKTFAAPHNEQHFLTQFIIHISL